MTGMCEMHAGSDPPKPPSLARAAERQNGLAERAAGDGHGEGRPESETTRGTQLGGTPGRSFESERLAQLAGTLSARLADWKWLGKYTRWRAGEPVSCFHRKMLAIMLARVRNGAMDWEDCARAKALPERSR